MPPGLTVRYREFPGILFGESDGRIYFDATLYIQKKEEAVNVSNVDIISGFECHFDWWIKNLSETCSIPLEDMIAEDADTGHLLLEESLDLLFIAYLEPIFSVYMLERISEMLINGVSLSDTALVMSVKDRFEKGDLIKFYEGDEEKQV